MKVEQLTLKELTPYARNPRLNDEAVNGVAASIKEFGFLRPIVIDADNVIVAGHTRLKAAQKLKLETVPCVRAKDLTDAQIKAYRLLDNKLAERASWEAELLRLELAELPDVDWTNFEAEWEEDIPPIEPDLSDDKVPEVQKEAISKLGDVWLCGEHRVMCGDSEDVRGFDELLTNVGSLVLLLTDPPYGIGRDKGFEGFGGFGPPIKRRQYQDKWDTERPSKRTFDLLLSKANVAMIFGGNFFADILPAGTHWIVWDKLNTMPTFGDCELIWTNCKRQSVSKITFEYNGLIGKEKERHHPTQKPVALLAQIIEEYATSDSLILDPFLGSGTTLIAAHRLNRICYGMEIEPLYVDVVLRRFYKETGIVPVKEDGTKFPVDKLAEK